MFQALGVRLESKPTKIPVLRETLYSNRDTGVNKRNKVSIQSGKDDNNKAEKVVRQLRSLSSGG